MKKALRIARKILFWTFFVCLFLTTTITVLLYIYEDDIKQYAIDEINNHLKTDIEVKDIELSLFHDFPYASLQFEEVFISDAFEERESDDTLLYAENMFFNFSILDIWNGDYKVKRIRAENGQLNLKTDENGDFNYGIVREKEERDSASNFKFMLELLKLNNIHFNYTNLSTKQFYKIDVINGLLKGDFTQSEYNLSAEGDLFVEQLKSNSFSLITDKEASLTLEMNIDTDEKRYTFKQGDLEIEKMPFKVTGLVDSASIDLAITGQQIKLSQLANSLLEDSFAETKEYEGDGLLDFQSEIKGPLSKTEMPSITADFSLVNGKLKEPIQQLQITDINLLGSYRNEYDGREESLEFKNASFRLLNSYFLGSMEVENFAQPKLRSKMNGDLDLAAFDRFFGFKGVEKIGGHVQFNMESILTFFDPQYRKDQFKVTQSDGMLSLKDVVYQKEGEELQFSGITGDLIVHDRDAAVRDLSVHTAKSSLVLNGALKNIVSYVEGSDGLGLIATIDADYIDLNEFIGESNSERDHPRVFQLPEHLNLNTELHVKQLDWENHSFTDISGRLLYANKKATIKKAKLKTLGGTVKANLTLNNGGESGNMIEGNISFQGVDVSKLFQEWDNFDQRSVTHEQLSGRTSGNIDVLLLFNPYFSILKDKMYVNSDIEISNGALTNLETMKSITDYMRTNKGLKLLLNKHIDQFEEKLLNLRFSKLKNRIEVKDGVIHIPKMKIASNALDLELFGWHDLENNVEYHFSFRFRDLKSKAEYTEFGKIEDDGLGLVIFLTMTGNLEDPLFALDKDERKNQVKENIAQEKETVKSILKSEFGLYKNDSTVQKMEEENKREVEFIYYEEDVQPEKDTVVKKKNKGKVGRFFQKLEKEEKEKKEFEIQN